jgi:hypothetical protein
MQATSEGVNILQILGVTLLLGITYAADMFLRSE